jgi:formate/nitrite transporter FocA (FNT family)
MRWICCIFAVIFNVLFFKYVGFMHQAYVASAFIGVELFIGWVLKESREDMPIRSKKILSGYLLGTYIGVILVVVLMYCKLIPVSAV